MHSDMTRKFSWLVLCGHVDEDGRSPLWELYIPIPRRVYDAFQLSPAQVLCAKHGMQPMLILPHLAGIELVW